MKSEVDIERIVKNIADTYCKIIEINLLDDSYICIKTMDKEEILYYSLTRWILEYTTNDKIFPEDRISFIKFMNLYSLKKYFDKNDDPKRFYYRRKNQNKNWSWVCLEINKDIAYTSEKPIVYLCIKKINDNHINNILDTYYHGNIEYDSKTKLRNYKSYKNKINSLEKEFPSSVGIICINTKDFSEEDFEKNLRILKLLFKFEQIYYIDNNKFSVIIENDDSEEFQLKLLQIYELFCANNLKDKIKIASCWSDDEDKGLEYIFKIIERKLYKADTIKE